MAISPRLATNSLENTAGLLVIDRRTVTSRTRSAQARRAPVRYQGDMTYRVGRPPRWPGPGRRGYRPGWSAVAARAARRSPAVLVLSGLVAVVAVAASLAVLIVVAVVLLRVTAPLFPLAVVLLV